MKKKVKITNAITTAIFIKNKKIEKKRKDFKKNEK